mgnify:FL=1
MKYFQLGSILALCSIVMATPIPDASPDILGCGLEGRPMKPLALSPECAW